MSDASSRQRSIGSFVASLKRKKEYELTAIGCDLRLAAAFAAGGDSDAEDVSAEARGAAEEESEDVAPKPRRRARKPRVAEGDEGVAPAA